jgi:hypothetical protein
VAELWISLSWPLSLNVQSPEKYFPTSTPKPIHRMSFTLLTPEFDLYACSYIFIQVHVTKRIEKENTSKSPYTHKPARLCTIVLEMTNKTLNSHLCALVS